MFGESTLLYHTFLYKLFFPEGMGVYKIVVEILKGWGAILVFKKWKFQGEGRAYVNFPPWWGYGYFLELHNTKYQRQKILSLYIA